MNRPRNLKDIVFNELDGNYLMDNEVIENKGDNEDDN